MKKFQLWKKSLSYSLADQGILLGLFLILLTITMVALSLIKGMHLFVDYHKKESLSARRRSFKEMLFPREGLLQVLMNYCNK